MRRKLPSFTDPSNHAIAEDAIRYFYKTCSLEEPKEFMWLESPYKCLKFWKMCKDANVDDLGKPIKENLNNLLSGLAYLSKHSNRSRRNDAFPLIDQLKEKLKVDVGIDTIYHSLYGIFSHTTPKLLDAQEMLKSPEDKEIVDKLISLYSETAWIIPYEKVCVISEKPTKFHINASLEFHHDEEKALAFKDGFGLYSINGVTIPDHIFEHPELITEKEIKSQINLEIRRIMIDKMGISKYLDAVHAKVIDMDVIYVFKAGDDRTMPRALMVDFEGNKYLVGTDGSTKRVYYMRVPPQAKTCSEAHSLIAGFDESRIIANS